MISFIASSTTVAVDDHVDVTVPVGTIDGDLVVVALTEYIPATAPPVPSVPGFTRQTTFNTGFAGKGTQVFTAAWDTATMGAPGTVTFTDPSGGGSEAWSVVAATYRSDTGTPPVQRCFAVQAAYAESNPGSWAFSDWFAGAPAATPFGPYDRLRSGGVIGPDDMCVYVFGATTTAGTMTGTVDANTRVPTASTVGGSPTTAAVRGLAAQDFSTFFTAMVGVCDEPGTDAIPGEHRDWAFTGPQPTIHTVGLLVRDPGGSDQAGFISGYMSW